MSIESLRSAVELACQSSSVPSIVRGRELVLAMPRPWVIEHLEVVAQEALNLSDEWEYRRLLELADLFDADLTQRIALIGRESSNPEVKEAAEGYIRPGECGTPSTREGTPLIIVAIEDDLHCETVGRFDTFGEAIGELMRLAEFPWDEPPNQAPCTSWKTCGREYHVLEYDTLHAPWKSLRNVHVLNISGKGAEWIDGFERAWLAAGE